MSQDYQMQDFQDIHIWDEKNQINVPPVMDAMIKLLASFCYIQDT